MTSCAGTSAGASASVGGGAGAINSASAGFINLREFALCYERHPESVRTVPWLRPAGGDSDPLHPAICFFLPPLLVF